MHVPRQVKKGSGKVNSMAKHKSSLAESIMEMAGYISKMALGVACQKVT